MKWAFAMKINVISVGSNNDTQPHCYSAYILFHQDVLESRSTRQNSIHFEWDCHQGIWIGEYLCPGWIGWLSSQLYPIWRLPLLVLCLNFLNQKAFVFVSVGYVVIDVGLCLWNEMSKAFSLALTIKHSCGSWMDILWIVTLCCYVIIEAGWVICEWNKIRC